MACAKCGLSDCVGDCVTLVEWERTWCEDCDGSDAECPTCEGTGHVERPRVDPMRRYYR